MTAFATRPAPTIAVSPRRIVGAVLDALLAIAVIAAIVPLAPDMPGDGLDPAWMLGMNQAVAQGLVFGRDVVFTFGPYASVFTRQYHPATDALMLAGSGVVAVAFLIALARLFGSTGWLFRAGLVLLFAAGLHSRDALLFAYPLAVGLVVRFALTGPPRSTGTDAVTLAVLFAPFGLLACVKGSLLLLCGAVLALSALALVLARRAMLAAIGVLAAAAGLLVSWMLAGQPFDAIPDYLAATVPIVAGYTDAMSRPGPASEPRAYGLAALLLLAVVAWHERRASGARRAFTLLLLAGVLLLAFKGAFVRHDDHALLAGSVILLAAVFVLGVYRSVGALLALAAALWTWSHIDARYTRSTLASLADRVQGTYASAWHGLLLRSDGALAPEFRDALRALGRGTPRLQGRVDAYTLRQGELVASGNAWRPRPVLQSYSAYTPALAQRNAAHLLASTAPDHVLLRLEPIDRRLPALEDGASWPALLRGYAPSALHGETLVLDKVRALPEKRATPAPAASFQLGELVPVPEGEAALVARLVLRPTPFGQAAGLAWKRAPLQVTLRLADGSTRTHRFIPGAAEAGFLLSPFVESARDFALLHAGGAALAHRRVLAFTVAAADADERMATWDPAYTLQVMPLALPRREGVLRVLDAQPLARTTDAVAPTEGSCVGQVESLAGTPEAAGPLRVRELLAVAGWLAPAEPSAPAPDAVWLALSDASGTRWIAQGARARRVDLSVLHGRAALAEAGYSFASDVSRLRGAHTLQLGYVAGGRRVLCPRFTRTVDFGPG